MEIFKAPIWVFYLDLLCSVECKTIFIFLLFNVLLFWISIGLIGISAKVFANVGVGTVRTVRIAITSVLNFCLLFVWLLFHFQLLIYFWPQK